MDLQRFMKFSAVSAGSALFFVSSIAFASMVDVTVSGNGSYQQWSSTTSSHYLSVQDVSGCNGNTNYVYTTTPKHRESFRVSLNSIPNASAITRIEIIPCASAHFVSGIPAIMKLFYTLNGVDSPNAGTYSLNTTTPLTQTGTIFGRLNIAKKSTDVLNIGAIYTSGSGGVRLSRIAARITYKPMIAPTNLAVRRLTATSSLLTWNDNTTAETGYSIERTTSEWWGPWSVVGTTAANATRFTDKTLSLGNTYYYRIRAMNGTVGSPYSNTASVITYYGVPSAPTNLVASTTGSMLILQWTDTSNQEDGFIVEQRYGTGAFMQLSTHSMDVTGYWGDVPTATGTYTYRVKAYNMNGSSAYSNESSITR